MPEQVINIVEIKNLKQLLVKNPNASIPLYNPDSGKVERILVADLVGGETIKVPWVIDQNYMIDEIAEFNNKIWKSLQDNNVGHQPYDDQTWWVEVSASTANGTALQPWAAGIFNIVNSSVTVNNVGYLLNNNVTLPFNSTDFATELAANKWLPLGSSGASIAANVSVDTTGFNDTTLTNVQTAIAKFDAAPSGALIKYEGVVLPKRAINNYIGRQVTVTDNGVDTTNITISDEIPFVASGEKIVTKTSSAVLVDKDILEMEVSAAPLDALSWTSSPATSAGSKGQKAYGASYTYECIGTNTWVRYLNQEMRMDLYLTAPIDDTLGERTNTQLDALYPSALIGQRAWGTSLAMYEKKDVANWKAFYYSSDLKIQTLTGVVADATFTVPQYNAIDTILLQNTTSNAVTIKIGTTSGGNDVVADVAVGASLFVDCILLKKFFSFTAGATIFVSSASWNSSNLTVKITTKKVY